jgi:transcription antitermination factor NusG
MAEIDSQPQLDGMESGCVEIRSKMPVCQESGNELVLPYLYPGNLLQSRQSESVTEQEKFSEPEGDVSQYDHSDKDPCWWLVYTKSRQEKKVAEQLAAFKVPHYLPVVERKSLSRGKTRTAQIPLFSSYLFLCGTDHDRIHALQTNRVTTMTQVVDGDQLRGDLLQIAQLIALGAPLTPESKLIKGQRVRVKSGLFAGYEGSVLERRGKTRLFVAVHYMNMGASMEVQDYLLEPI